MVYDMVEYKHTKEIKGMNEPQMEDDGFMIH